MVNTNKDKETQEKELRQQTLNMQINYYIMRRLFANVRGKERKGDSTGFHGTVIQTSRTRVNRVIDGFDTRFSSEEVTELAKRTGVPTAYFSGHKRIPLGEDLDWGKFCELRHRKQLKSENRLKFTLIEETAYNKLYKEINAMIDSYPVDEDKKFDTNNPIDIYLYFLKNPTPYNNQAGSILKRTAESIRQVNLNILESATQLQLRAYSKVLSEQLKTVNAILLIKECKEGKNQPKKQ